MDAKIAIPIDNDSIFSHFGKASKFKVYTIVNNEVTTSEVLEASTTDHVEVALWLVQREVRAVICDGIGPGAQGALAAAGVIALAGISGIADEAVAKLLNGELAPKNIATCARHGGCHSGGCSCHGGGCHGGCH